MSAQRSEYAVGEPVYLHLQLVNHGDSMFGYEDQPVAVNNSLDITDAKGREVEYTAPLVQTNGASKIIRSGQTKVLFERFDAVEQYALDRPGEYRIRFNGERLWFGIAVEDATGSLVSSTYYPNKLVSNVITITLVEPDN